jgi:hypothetical protein
VSRTIGILLPLGFLGMLHIAAQSGAQSDVQSIDTLGSTKETALICTLSAFFSTDLSPHLHSKSKNERLRLEGRGLISCKNDQGFSTELPVLADLEAKFPEPPALESEFSFSGNSSPFVVSGDINKVHDRYHAQSRSWLKKNPTTPALLFRGMRHDLVMEMTLTSPLPGLSRLEVTGMRLHFDDSAPDLRD